MVVDTPIETIYDIAHRISRESNAREIAFGYFHLDIHVFAELNI